MHTPPTLTDLAEGAIRSCLGNSTLVSGAGEVAEVARLVLQLPNAIVSAWSSKLVAGELDVLGVFCHKTPKTSWTDFRTNTVRKPEFCDLMLVFDCDEGTARTRRALVIQAKTADTGASAGQFSIASGSEEYQRYLYAHLPKFKLTGLPRPATTPFDIAPNPLGGCPGVRYACVNVNAAAPASGWWIEVGQPAIPSLGIYHGRINATQSLGEALHQMLDGKLGAPLTAGSEWERVVLHLESAAKGRQKRKKTPPDVVATAAGTVLPHMAAASLFISHPRSFFESKATSGANDGAYRSEPPFLSSDHLLSVPEGSDGFGIIYVRVIAPEWRNSD